MALNDFDKEEICRLYREELESTVTIAKHFNLSITQIRNVLKEKGEYIRDKSEAQHLAIEKGRKKPPMAGKRHDGKTRKKISETMLKEKND